MLFSQSVIYLFVAIETRDEFGFGAEISLYLIQMLGIASIRKVGLLISFFFETVASERRDNPETAKERTVYCR